MQTPNNNLSGAVRVQQAVFPSSPWKWAARAEPPAPHATISAAAIGGLERAVVPGLAQAGTPYVEAVTGGLLQGVEHAGSAGRIAQGAPEAVCSQVEVALPWASLELAL